MVERTSRNMMRFVRKPWVLILILSVAVVVGLVAASVFAYRMVVPDIKTGDEAVSLMRESFDFELNPEFSTVIGLRNPLGYGYFYLRNDDATFSIGATTGNNERNNQEIGELPDYDGEARWQLESSESLVVRGQPVTLWRYRGQVSGEARDLRGWVIKFRGNDGIVKVSIMGWEGFFDESVALEFIASIR